MAVLFVAGEMDDMMRTWTNLIVIKDRRKVAELTGAEVSSDNVMRAIAGGESA